MILSICVDPDTLVRFPELSGEVVFLSKTLGHYSIDKGYNAALERVESRLFYNKVLRVDVVSADKEFLHERPIPETGDIHIVIRSNPYFVS